MFYSWKARRWHRRRVRLARRQERDLERAASRGVKLIPEWDLRQPERPADRAYTLTAPERAAVNEESTRHSWIVDPIAPALDAEELARRLGLRCPECGAGLETRSLTTAGLLNVEYTTLRGYGALIYAECREHGMVSRSITHQHLKTITGRAA